jgi:transcriptional regulator with XRE-family HTH domain
MNSTVHALLEERWTGDDLGMTTCRCRVPDWRALREALGLTQEEFAELLSLSRTGVQWIEAQQPHRCPSRQTVTLLQLWLSTPTLRRRLELAGYPHPYPEFADAAQTLLSQRSASSSRSSE